MASRDPAAIVVSPHFDDAVLSCWSVLNRGGSKVCVLTVFGGAPSPGRLWDWDAKPPGATDSATRVLERSEENRAALRVTGTRRIDLHFLESQYLDAGGGVLDASVLRPQLMNASTVYAPAGVGRERIHPDHVTVRDAVLAIRTDALLYSDQPYCRFPRDLELAPGLDGFEREVITLTAAEARMKAAAIACYAGEVRRLEGLEAMLAQATDELRYEVLWRRPSGQPIK
jgi:LmbE family N-acetylglucosaminyl deacetylase